mgnify:CR=1 FL=1
MDYINSIQTDGQGGGCTADIIRLKDGKVIALNDEALVVFESYADYIKSDDVINGGEAPITKSIWL